VVVAVLAVLVFGVTSPLAMSDSDIKRRFASDQLGKGLGVGFNGEIAGLLDRGCTLFSSTTHFYTIHAFQRHRSRIEFFYFTHPPDAAIEQRFRDATNCVAILYPSDRTTPALLAFIDSFSQSRGLQKLREDRGMILMASR
jgi:hypothetical protein